MHRLHRTRPQEAKNVLNDFERVKPRNGGAKAGSDTVSACIFPDQLEASHITAEKKQPNRSTVQQAKSA